MNHSQNHTNPATRALQVPDDADWMAKNRDRVRVLEEQGLEIILDRIYPETVGLGDDTDPTSYTGTKLLTRKWAEFLLTGTTKDANCLLTLEFHGKKIAWDPYTVQELGRITVSVMNRHYVSRHSIRKEFDGLRFEAKGVLEKNDDGKYHDHLYTFVPDDIRRDWNRIHPPRKTKDGTWEQKKLGEILTLELRRWHHRLKEAGITVHVSPFVTEGWTKETVVSYLMKKATTSNTLEWIHVIG